ncbi:MAG: glycosyltransferase [Sarcina sp.]
MKILQINSVCGFGSTGRIVTDLYKIYEEAGHECIIAYGRGQAPEGYKTIKIGSKLDMYKHIAKARTLDGAGFGSVKATKKFIEDIEKYNPDIIHLHNIHGYYINIEELFSYLKKANKKVIWTLHDCWPFTGHCAYFEYAQCDKWKEGCDSCKQKKEYPKSILLDKSKSNYEKKKRIFTGVKDMTIITPSEWLANIVEKSFLSEYQVKVINNGIDLDAFHPYKSNLRNTYNIVDKKIILGVASVWEKRKGLDYFIGLSKKISNEYKIILVGLNEKQKEHLPENIIGITRTTSIKELAELYSIADVFLNPTLEDNYPTTNLESLACGTPVLTFNSGGSPEAILDNEILGTVIKEKSVTSIQQELQCFFEGNTKKNVEQKIIDYASRFDKYKKFKEYIECI